MTPLPKQKLPKGRRNRRRATQALKPVDLISCPNCQKPRRAHQVCQSCGFYKGKKVL